MKRWPKWMFPLAVTMGLTMALAGGAVRGDEAGAADKFERDRQAILAMAGEYHVTFQFHETVGFAADYVPHEPHRSEALELVEVIEDRGDFISLQHILVVRDEETGEPRVVKHWRQDWAHEAARLTEYRGRRTWETAALSPGEVTGTWTQTVYQVDDSPRYAGIGRWIHVGDYSTWESQPTWRPLPRREYTTRDDYDVLQARNRHTITPTGWVHEQDNRKLVLDEGGAVQRVVAHELGLNLYERRDDADLSAARAYWRRTAGFWRQVREAWNDVLDEPGRISIAAEIEGRRLGQAMSDLVEEMDEVEAQAAVMRSAVRASIGRYVAVP